MNESPVNRDELIDAIARRIVGCGMEVPAVFFLEMNKPLAFITGQALLVGAGIFAPFVGLDRWNDFCQLMSERVNVERLIQRIEQLAAQPGTRTGEPPAQAALDSTVHLGKG